MDSSGGVCWYSCAYSASPGVLAAQFTWQGESMYRHVSSSCVLGGNPLFLVHAGENLE